MGSTEKKGTVKAILIMVFSMFMSRGIGFIRTAVLAGQAGTGTAADAYAFSFLLPDLLNQMLAGGVLSVTFIPLFQSLDHDRKAQNRFFSNLFWIGTALFSVGIAIMWIFTPQLLLLAAGKNIAQSEAFGLTVDLTRIILPAQLFFFWGALLNGVQYANKRFFVPSLTPVLYNIGIIAGGVALAPYIGINGFAWGVVAGAFVGNVAVQIPGVMKMGTALVPVLDKNDPLLREWLFKTLPLIFTLGLAFSNELMGRIYGSRSPEGTGALSALNYAYRLFMIFVGIFGQAFAGGIYPFITRMANENKLAEMETMVFSTLEKTAVFTLLGSALLFATRYDVTALLFQRGSFTADSTLITANALAAYLPGMFFFSAIMILNRPFFALRKTYTTLAISLITLAITIPIYSTIGLKLGVIGIGLTGSLASLITYSLLLVQWKKVHPESKVKAFTLRTIHILIVSLAVALVAVALSKLPMPQEQTVLWQIVRIIVQSIPPLVLALIYFDRSGILSLKSLMRRGR